MTAPKTNPAFLRPRRTRSCTHCVLYALYHRVPTHIIPRFTRKMQVSAQRSNELRMSPSLPRLNRTPRTGPGSYAEFHERLLEILATVDATRAERGSRVWTSEAAGASAWSTTYKGCPYWGTRSGLALPSAAQIRSNGLSSSCPPLDDGELEATQDALPRFKSALELAQVDQLPPTQDACSLGGQSPPEQAEALGKSTARLGCRTPFQSPLPTRSGSPPHLMLPPPVARRSVRSLRSRSRSPVRASSVSPVRSRSRSLTRTRSQSPRVRHRIARAPLSDPPSAPSPRFARSPSF